MSVIPAMSLRLSAARSRVKARITPSPLASPPIASRRRCTDLVFGMNLSLFRYAKTGNPFRRRLTGSPFASRMFVIRRRFRYAKILAGLTGYPTLEDRVTRSSQHCDFNLERDHDSGPRPRSHSAVDRPYRLHGTLLA